MCSGPVIPIVFEGLNATKIGRQMVGPSEPYKSLPGTIRGDFSLDIERTVVHGSHNVEAANREINLWFRNNELISWTPSNLEWIFELAIN